MAENNPDNRHQTSDSQAVSAQQDDTVTIQVPSEPVANPGQDGTDDQQQDYGYGLFKRPIKYDPIMMVYIVILFAGGLAGYINKNSTASLVASTVFSVLLAFSVYLEGARKNSYPMLTILLVLTGMFFYRFYLNATFVPSGLFAVLSLLMLARHSYIFYIRCRASSSSSRPASS